MNLDDYYQKKKSTTSMKEQPMEKVLVIKAIWSITTASLIRVMVDW